MKMEDFGGGVKRYEIIMRKKIFNANKTRARDDMKHGEEVEGKDSKLVVGWRDLCALTSNLSGGKWGKCLMMKNSHVKGSKEIFSLRKWKIYVF